MPGFCDPCPGKTTAIIATEDTWGLGMMEVIWVMEVMEGKASNGSHAVPHKSSLLPHLNHPFTSITFVIRPIRSAWHSPRRWFASCRRHQARESRKGG